MKIRTLIVDDVSLARQRIKILLTDPEIEIAGECANGQEAAEAIEYLKPDLIFLDVQMPEMSGFEVVEAIGAENMPAVIFVTAFDEFAIRAFEINAVNYLLKPFEQERLNKAVERARLQINSRMPTADIEEKLKRVLDEVRIKHKYLKRIPVKSSRGINLISTEEIDWISASGHYVELYVGREEHLIREKMSNLEQKLDLEKFIRIHRSTIVNIDQIKSMHPLFKGDHIIILRNGTKLSLSRTYHEKLMSLLSK